MKKRPLSLMTSLAALAAALVLGVCAPARADLEIQLSTNGTSYTKVDSKPSGSVALYGLPSATFGGITFQVLNTISDSPGGGSSASLMGGATSVSNLTSKTQTVYIKLGDTGYTTPKTPPGFIQLVSSVGGAVSVPNKANALVFQSYIDPANGQNSLAGFTPGSQTPGISGTPVQSFNNSTLSTISHLATTYSVTEFLKITLGARSAFNFSASTTVSLVPEPSSLAIAGLGMLGMIGYGIRRRRIV